MVDYTIKRSNRKTLSIIVESDCRVVVLAPEKMTDKEIHTTVLSREFWIYKQLAEFKLLNQSKIQREFVNGEGFMYLGRSYKLKLVDEQDAPLKLKNGYFNLKKSSISKAPETFKEFYRKKGAERISSRIEIYSSKLGLSVNKIKVMELKSRWASCGKNNSLYFNWKCVMAPYSVIDYIVVHELVHLIYPNHSNDFWNQVDKVLPEYRQSLEWLRKNGASLDI